MSEIHPDSVTDVPAMHSEIDHTLLSGLWVPSVGSETNEVISKLPGGEREQLERESCEILANCVPPTEVSGCRTGLVVGYVQSGKTLSFTTVAALAHDNHYRLVIVIAGTSTNLLHQSTDRLLEDLNAEGFWGRWRLYRSDEPELRTGNAELIRADLQRWEDPDIEEDEQRTVLITVMKERAHLDRVIKVLSQLELSAAPTLVIDDEADQASLNIAIRNDDESSTYRRILRLRSLLPHHTFIQYTATPQAVLLINLIDQLSPDFGKVLTPGTLYTGGQTFFGGGLELIKRIPPTDVPTKNQPLVQPPDSLLEALQFFFIGVAAGITQRYSDVRNRSMMIHPTHRTDSHAQFALWARTIKQNWERTLELSTNDRDRIELIAEFQVAYADLRETVADLPSFGEILRRLPRAIREARVEAVNAADGTTPVINWKRAYAWILVGGQALDRGFTVEGLTVTYMPRGIGVGNADTVQQRARWFGYKANYLGYCRVFLPRDVVDAFREYVEHEEDVRSRLSGHLSAGMPLKRWKRAFLLSGRLHPTRYAVIGHDVSRGEFSDRWFSPRSPHVSSDSLADNRAIVDTFSSGLSWSRDNDDPQLLASHRHDVAKDVRLKDAYERFLVDFTYAVPFDSVNHTGILLQIGAYLDKHPEATCSIYRMRPTEVTARGTDDEGQEISQLFQGAYPVAGSVKVYPGDRQIKAQSGLSIQIHMIDVYRGPASDGVLLEAQVPVVATWVPSEMSAAWVVQDQSDAN